MRMYWFVSVQLVYGWVHKFVLSLGQVHQPMCVSARDHVWLHVRMWVSMSIVVSLYVNDSSTFTTVAVFRIPKNCKMLWKWLRSSDVKGIKWIFRSQQKNSNKSFFVVKPSFELSVVYITTSWEQKRRGALIKFANIIFSFFGCINAWTSGASLKKITFAEPSLDNKLFFA